MTNLPELAKPYGIALTKEMATQFAVYQEMLLRWNEKINLTAITQPREIAEKHFLDSLMLLAAREIPRGSRLIDVGTGAGFPGIPLKIARPDIQLTLLDSLQKRTVFLGELSRALGQENEIIHGRAEEVAHSAGHREAYDFASARAVAALSLLSEICLPFLCVGGVFCAMKGPDCNEEVKGAEAGITLLGGDAATFYPYQLPTSGRRVICMSEKSSQTPQIYPRKHKQMTKKPL